MGGWVGGRKCNLFRMALNSKRREGKALLMILDLIYLHSVTFEDEGEKY